MGSGSGEPSFNTDLSPSPTQMLPSQPRLSPSEAHLSPHLLLFQSSSFLDAPPRSMHCKHEKNKSQEKTETKREPLPPPNLVKENHPFSP